MHWGPQPYEAAISEMCEAFHCTPDVAEQQDFALVQRILEYRKAKAAVAAFDRGAKGVKVLQSHPDWLELLAEMHRAQLNTEVTGVQLLADMDEREADDGD